MSRHLRCTVVFLATATAFATGGESNDRVARYTVFRLGCSRSFELLHTHKTIASALAEAEQFQQKNDGEYAIAVGEYSDAFDLSIPFVAGKIKSCQIWIRGCKGPRKGTRFDDRNQALRRVRQLKDEGETVLIVYALETHE